MNHIEKMQCDFLWHGKEKKKFHLIKWSQVCKPKKEGGLGIRALKKLNSALLGKWLWRIGDETEGLWKEVISTKYDISRNGWFVQDPSTCSSGLWKGILAAKEVYMKQVRLRVGRCDKICFWTNL